MGTCTALWAMLVVADAAHADLPIVDVLHRAANPNHLLHHEGVVPRVTLARSPRGDRRVGLNLDGQRRFICASAMALPRYSGYLLAVVFAARLLFSVNGRKIRRKVAARIQI